MADNNVTLAGVGGQEIYDWFEAENDRREELNIFTLIQTGLQIAQLIIYYNKLDDAIDKRDEKIDAQIEWMQELEDYKETQDLPMLNLKASALTALGLPTVDMCGDAVRNASMSVNDGEAVDDKSQTIAGRTCRGVPEGWATHDGGLAAGRAASYAGGMMANSAKRRQEYFQTQKTKIVRAAQQGMKAVYNASDTLAMYSQAVAIHSGFADLFMQGFNSAGAGLGVALGQLAGSGTSNAAGTDRTVVSGEASTAATRPSIYRSKE